MKVTWSQDPTQPNRQHPCCSNLDGSVSNIHFTALAWLHFAAAEKDKFSVYTYIVHSVKIKCMISACHRVVSNGL